MASCQSTTATEPSSAKKDQRDRIVLVARDPRRDPDHELLAPAQASLREFVAVAIEEPWPADLEHRAEGEHIRVVEARHPVERGQRCVLEPGTVVSREQIDRSFGLLASRSGEVIAWDGRSEILQHQARRVERVEVHLGHADVELSGDVAVEVVFALPHPRHLADGAPARVRRRQLDDHGARNTRRRRDDAHPGELAHEALAGRDRLHLDRLEVCTERVREPRGVDVCNRDGSRHDRILPGGM
jgi:hypothetical protein